MPNSVVRQFAREIVERFKPCKIILFGSHAYGKPNSRSDVDILVVMPCGNELDQDTLVIYFFFTAFARGLLSGSADCCSA